MTKSEVVKKQKEELDRFREVFALAVEGDDSDMVKDLKAKLDIMHKRHDMERKAWGIDETKKDASAAKKKSKSRTISPELREKLDEVYGSGQCQ
ncbi:hypothetical protein [Maridesulfovibrio hydrothermalis]|uniref:Uncharacterized protein n=1 Tax=Maridesulfovibrio hydrothermalis AM13 = DSM 14728 TaxID=1121451 RepID=L0RE31_9BACT|nr:hypothetical protein [Maridesulfovibrio hydrothermalis]CCO25014.1 conserved protein of unknown function [Maridesulfovibrio hydrothermalis AM13 = DSM 14728]